jgi:hypothetical protein
MSDIQKSASEEAVEAASAALDPYVPKWNLPLNPENSDELAHSMLAAAYPIIRADIVREIVEWLEHGAPVAAKWVREREHFAEYDER